MSETENSPTTEALQAELDRLRTKNVELLAELKTAKATATEAQGALEALQGERDAALAEVRTLRLDGPVAAMLADVSVDGELFGQMFGRHYQFGLDDSGAIVITDAEGKPAMVTDPGTVRTHGRRSGNDYREERTPGETRPATFTAGDVRMLAEQTSEADKFLHLIPAGATGGGSPGSNGTPPSPRAKPAPEAPAPQQFGLR